MAARKRSYTRSLHQRESKMLRTDTGREALKALQGQKRPTKWDNYTNTPRPLIRASELRALNNLASAYNIEVRTLMERGVRLLVDTVLRYPHTPVSRELVSPASGRWDQPIRPDDLGE